MGKFIDLTGRTFGWLRVIKRAPNSSRGVCWLCVCRCGNRPTVGSPELRNHIVVSCGCWRNEQAARQGRRMRIHGHSHARRGLPSSTYQSWQNMLARCVNPNHQHYPLYGGAGVRVCAAWRTFKGFYLAMGRRPKGTTLGRFKDTGDYKPSNCAWMTRAQQRAEARKKRRKP